MFGKISRVDLISLESPFQDNSEFNNFTEPVEISDDFEAIWQSFGDLCDLRGWCNIPIDKVIRRLQWVEQHYLRVISADLAPFVGNSLPYLYSKAESNVLLKEN